MISEQPCRLFRYRRTRHQTLHAGARTRGIHSTHAHTQVHPENARICTCSREETHRTVYKNAQEEKMGRLAPRHRMSVTHCSGLPVRGIFPPEHISPCHTALQTTFCGVQAPHAQSLPPPWPWPTSTPALRPPPQPSLPAAHPGSTGLPSPFCPHQALRPRASQVATGWWPAAAHGGSASCSLATFSFS